MPSENSILKILSARLPGHITKPLFREYEWRKAEIQRIFDRGYDRYRVLSEYGSTLDALLAMSLFYRHVIAKLNGASDFYVHVKKTTGTDTPIQIGKFTLDYKERNRLLAVQMQFNQIADNFQIPDNFFDYADTMDFLQKCIALYHTPEQYGENDTI